MFFKLLYIVCILMLFVFVPALHAQVRNQQTSKPVYVIVHGAWGGSWAFKKVDSLMTSKNTVVYRPSLTGLGERVHLADTNIGLHTHIKDVLNTILFEDLHNIILVGHSYGGMVITGVADSIPERIASVIYLDAFVPSDGESLVSIAGNGAQRLTQSAGSGFIVPVWVKAGQRPPKDVPHPLKTFTDRIHLKTAVANKWKTTYILTVAKGVAAKDDDFGSQAIRATQRGWKVVQLEADHNPQWSKPEELSRLLLENR